MPKQGKSARAWMPTSLFIRWSAGQGKFASQRPTFYRCATPPTEAHMLCLQESATSRCGLTACLKQSQVTWSHRANGLCSQVHWAWRGLYAMAIFFSLSVCLLVCFVCCLKCILVGHWHERPRSAIVLSLYWVHITNVNAKHTLTKIKTISTQRRTQWTKTANQKLAQNQATKTSQTEPAFCGRLEWVCGESWGSKQAHRVIH